MSIDVGLSVATTNRSKCQFCKESIAKDENRVSFPGRHSNLSVCKWLHPQCFADNSIIVDYGEHHFFLACLLCCC